MLQINNLHAMVGGTEILKGLTLSLNPGEIHAIMGPNGSGKSSILKAIMGLVPRRTGRIAFQGRDLTARVRDVTAWRCVSIAAEAPREAAAPATITPPR